METCLCSFLSTAAAQHPAEKSAESRCFLSTNFRKPIMNISLFKAFFPKEPCGPSLTTILMSHFTTLVHAVQSLDFVMTQQFFRGIHD